MSLRDKQFYSQLFFWLVVLGVLLRLLIMFVGIQMRIPYLDPFLETTMRIVGAAIRAFAGFLGGWSSG